MIRRLTQGLTPLRHRGFRRLAGGQLASAVGDSCYAVALPWYVLATHGGTLLLGTVLAAYGIPRTAGLVLGGHAADRWRPWTVMMTSDAVRVVAVGAMAVAAAAGPARAVILVPMAVVLGAGEGFFLPGSFSVIPELLPAGDLLAGNALSSAGNQVAMLAGPAIGGVLVGCLGPAPAFAFDAATFVISAATLAGVRAAQRASRPAGANVAETAGGVAAAAAAPALGSMLRSERVLQVILLVVLAANLGMGGEGEVALPALAHGPLHAGAGGYGGLVAAFAAGALGGTLAAGQIRGGRRPAIVGSAVFLAEAVFLAAVPFLGGVLPDGAALVAVGALNGLGNVMMITLFQRWAPPALLGRLMGLVMLAAFGTFPVSVALGAVLVHAIGPAPFFPVAAAITAAAILAGLSQRSWRNLGARQAPARATAAATTVTGS